MIQPLNFILLDISEPSLKSYLEQQKITYAKEISDASKEVVQTYDNYAAQHQAFVNHAEKSIAGLEQQIKENEDKIEAAKKVWLGTRFFFMGIFPFLLFIFYTHFS